MNFLKFWPVYAFVSAALVLGSVLALGLWGLRPAIDFTGGSLLEYRFAQLPDTAEIKQAIKDGTGIEIAVAQTAADNHMILKAAHLSAEQAKQVTQSLQTKYSEVTEERVESVGPVLGKELLRKTIVAVLLTAGFILAYIAWTFKNWQYGVSAVAAMFHDTLILLGSFAVLGRFFGVEVDTLFVTAVLTTLSFSVHDTVVVYDRIREARRQFPKVSLEMLANKSVTETMSRSLNNSLTIIFMLAALLLLGGETIKWFVTALLVGTIVGTYSSPFVAVPLVVLWEKLVSKKKS